MGAIVGAAVGAIVTALVATGPTAPIVGINVEDRFDRLEHKVDAEMSRLRSLIVLTYCCLLIVILVKR